MFRALGTALLLGIALLSFACSGGSKKEDAAREPEIIRSGQGTGSRATSAAPPEIVRSSTGSTTLTVVPLGQSSAGDIATATARGLTIRHTETATVAADTGFVVALLPIRPSGPTPFGSLSDRERTQVISALEAVGVKKEDVSIDSSLNYGPLASVSVKVPLKDINAQGKRIIDAIEGAQGRAQSSGARFSLSNCTTGLDPLRRTAFAAATEEAKVLAQAASVTLGPISGVSEQLIPSFSSFGPPSADPCDPQAASGPRAPGSLAALDATPEVKLSLQISVTYSLGDAGAGGVTASGTGNATAKADEGYVVAVVGNPGSFGPGPFGPPSVDKKGRDDLISKLKGLKLDEDDIEVASASDGTGRTVVSVEVDAKDVATKGKEIVAAVEDVLGRSQTQGAWFSHTNCRAVLAEARKQALADAKASAESLAGAAGLKLGKIVAVSDVTLPSVSYGPPSARNPCDEDIAQFAVGGPYGVPLVSFEAEPEFKVSAALSVTYAIEGQ